VSEIFSTAWNEYPTRDGSNAERAALEAWEATVARYSKKASREAIERTMLEGVRAYRRHCDATGRSGTRYVMATKNFFGPDEHWARSWGSPASAPDPQAGEVIERIKRYEQESLNETPEERGQLIEEMRRHRAAK